MAEIIAGQKAPYFEGTDQNGNTIKLDDYKGKKLVLYFYPKDNTPGCTKEACSFRDSYSEMISKGFDIVGVSADSEKSHQKFADKFELPFPLIADTKKTIMEAYGTFGEKKMYGKSFLGVKRTTFIINEEGVVEKVIKKVDTADSASQIFKLYE
ncbi:MAG: thioredoxin-dependent thiol peroxidase [Marinilabiliaceae bacterium]|jgi:peroxiredoxin Q/BCP|nr:thioredoxin-dependent thiol peroxidase [Marinilabiliaceae bacterium]